MRVPLTSCVVGIGLIAFAARASSAQDRLKAMPGFANYQAMLCQYQGAVVSGAVDLNARSRFFRGGNRNAGCGADAATPSAPPEPVAWDSNGRGVAYSWNGKRYHFDITTRRATELPVAPYAGDPSGPAERPRPRMAGPVELDCRGDTVPPRERGRQSPVTPSPDGKYLANYRDRNLYLCKAGGGPETAITTMGSEKSRVKYGTASWVYGEELGQTTAMWWNPDGTKLAYFRFDESEVPDFYITTDETKLQTTLDVEAYPKPGVPNPVVDLFVYDVATGHTTQVDVRDGHPFANDAIGYYVYDVAWSPNGKEVLIHRTNRRQNVLELAGCDPTSGRCRVIVHETWPTGWVENHPDMQYLSDNNRFLWESERSGFRNYYLYNLQGQLLATVTNHPFETAGIVRIDEPHHALWYLARDGGNFMKLQLHRVNLDGTQDRRLTDPAFNHQISLSPDGAYFIDVAQTHDQPPVTRLISTRDGAVVGELAVSDVSLMTQRGIRPPERYSYLAADGKTTLYGEIWFPINFDSTRSYPIITAEYGGPAAGTGVSENFSADNPQTEYGFLVVTLSSRAAPGMGKRTLDDIYLKLGQTEMDDMALGIKALWNRPYVDKNRVGIYGTSYGGYTAVMEILRHPDVFTVASSSSPPTDWRNYDTIYTERYMWIPSENKEGYDKGSAMTYVDNLTGRLLLDYGSIDNNVHNTNMMQLIKALQRAGKSFEVQVQPDVGHSGVNGARMMEFLIENLIEYPQRIHQGYTEPTGN